VNDNHRLEEERMTAKRARMIGMAYTDASQIIDKALYKDLLTVKELYDLKIIPLESNEHYIHFGITTTTSQQTLKSLRQRFIDQSLNFSIISDTSYKDYMKLYDPPKQVIYQNISLSNAGSEELISSASSVLEQIKADDMLAYLVAQAHKLNASDIHLETQSEKIVRIRFRLDGVLHVIAKISSEKYRILIAAIASSGNVSTSSEDSQQGHIATKVKMADGQLVDVNVRLETVPTINGMDIVMRLFNMQQEMYNLDRLGLSPKERSAVDGIIARPSGLVLVVGPTGSGKTTTLYSMLNSLNIDSRKIVTIEDPVEYQFNGISQISVTSKNSNETSFADKLRAVLRLDPDVIMVGEIRDNDTAKTALQASLTGHLVLSTFHASSASAALTRLVDVIGQNPLFVSAIRLIMAQRLVRKLDDNTKQPDNPATELMARAQLVVDSLPSGEIKPELSKITFYKPGSSADNPFGFRGQIPLREQLSISPELTKLLEGMNGNLTSQEIENAAVGSGMLTMLHDGILKACAGQTTLDEVFRVLG
jgi:type IV pilus assembly protein PilB